MPDFKQYIFILLIVTNSINIFGQENKIDRNAIYYELGGTGFGPFSINYERNFSINKKIIFAPGVGISLSKYIHVGGTSYINDYQLFIPLQVNFIFGEKNHQFETGYGMPIAIKDNKFGIAGSIYVLRFGYRYQHKQSGFLIRASINPSVIVNVPTIMGGLSVGYTF
ncbi:MAG: hypothetical protein U9N85_02490 [Bacteroidota bacterium]|nr:hypothetical protein [Bacteroidota bacterium]